MTVVEEIIDARHCGLVRCGLSSNKSPSVSELAAEFGLGSDPGIYREIDEPEARRLIRLVLHQDLAYDAKLMSVEKASELTDGFLEQFGTGETRFYTNGKFYERGTGRWLNSWTWIPATMATFDTGVLVRGATVSGCLWVEDED
jgi:hypothetical protein